MPVRPQTKKSTPTRTDNESAIAYVEGTREGAFGAWSSSPVVRALLLPFTGLGALELIRLLSM